MNRLATLRFAVEHSRGRRFPELSHPYRNEFQRDRDRIVHARAFRRLENKTQVFAPDVSDHFRNRLTHTIEVAQIARTIASVLELNEDFTEALALVHDVGHPPFAHAGEEELDRRMREFGERFDHNLQALRVVEHFEHRYARFPGLNLTFEVCEGIVKHSRDYQLGESASADEYLPGLRPPLEAQLIDLADEAAYNTADLDDGFAAGLFSIEDARNAVARFDQMYDEIEGQFPGASERVRFNEVLRGLIDWLVSGLIEGTLQTAQDAGLKDVDAVREHPRRIAAFTPDAQATVRQLKQFLYHYVYFSDTLVHERGRTSVMISSLFDFLMQHPESMPEEYREFAADVPLHRAVCDYIAGMTDGFFQRTYTRLLG